MGTQQGQGRALVPTREAQGEQGIEKYGKWDASAVVEEQKFLDEGDGGEFMKLAVGRNVVRFLPPPPGARSPFLVVYQHYVEVPGVQKPVVFACPRVMLKKPCPACQKAAELRRTGNPADYDFAAKLMPRRRVFAEVINRAEPERGVQVLAFGKLIHEELRKLRDENEGGGDYTDPVNGFDIIIHRTGTGKNDTEYSVKAVRTNSPLGNDEWLEMRPGLDRFGVVKSAEQIMELLSGVASGATGGQVRRAVAPAQGGRAIPRATAQRMVEGPLDPDADGDDNPFGV